MSEAPAQAASFGARAAAWIVDAVPHALVPYLAVRWSGSAAIGVAGLPVLDVSISYLLFQSSERGSLACLYG